MEFLHESRRDDLASTGALQPPQRRKPSFTIDVLASDDRASKPLVRYQPLITGISERLNAVEVTVVLPCLNEAETVGTCIRRAVGALQESGISGEIVVADNDSADNSREVAEALGARVVRTSTLGYGAAVMSGIEAAQGRYILIGDADNSYDFGELPEFVYKLREGYELVQGCRLPSGGGDVEPGAMPFLHRWLGNPLFSVLARVWFGAPVHDVHCGLRALTGDLYARLGLQCIGMEFASEMVIKATLMGSRIAEVPITLHADGRTAHPPHLRTLRDGWRHLRFYLMYCPRWLFVIPGVGLILLGLIGYSAAMWNSGNPTPQLGVHVLCLASCAIVTGFQSVLFAALAKTFAITQGLLPVDDVMTRLWNVVPLERALGAAIFIMLAGTIMICKSMSHQQLADSEVELAEAMRWLIPGLTFAMLGVQMILSSFLLSILGLRRR
jgi:glycosyltransferase involved in cell wall biosynthesis